MIMIMDKTFKLIMIMDIIIMIMDKTFKLIKQLNDFLDKIIDKSKSFEEQIELVRKVENLDEYCFMDHYDDKKFKFKIFKLKLAYLSNIDKKIFEQIFGHTFETANNLIKTTNKEKNQIIFSNINENLTKTLRRKTLRRR